MKDEKQVRELLTIVRSMHAPAEQAAKEAMEEFRKNKGDPMEVSSLIYTLYTVGGIINGLEWVLGDREVGIQVVADKATPYKM